VFLHVVVVEQAHQARYQTHDNEDREHRALKLLSESVVHVSPWGEPHAFIMGNPSAVVKGHGHFFCIFSPGLDAGGFCAYNRSVEKLLLTQERVGFLLGVGPRTVKQMAKAGQIDSVTLPGGAVRYTRASVLALGGVKDKAPAQGEGGPGETVGLVHSTSPVAPCATVEEKN
jgi:hypothetical protein